MFKSTLTLLFTFLCLTQLAAQEDGQKMVADCISAQKEKFLPLKHQTDQIYSVYASRGSVVREAIRWLEKTPAVAEQKRLDEIAKLTARLETLKSLEGMTSGDAIAEDNLKGTIEKAYTLIDDFDDQRDEARRPFEKQKSALERQFKPNQEKLKPVLVSLFREVGDNEMTAEIKRSYASFYYAMAEASAQFKRGDKSACSIRVILVHDDMPDEKLGKMDDKYPYITQRDSQLEILVGTAKVSIYASDSALRKDNLPKTLKGLVDLEALEKLVRSKTTERP